MSKLSGPKRVTLDIETMPAVAEVFSLWDSHIPIQRVRAPGYVFGFGFKWADSRRVDWVSGDDVAPAAYELLDRADIAVTYNGDKFDFGHLNKTMLLNDITPPSNYRSVDLYKTVKQRFKFESNKLDYVAQQLGLGNKLQTEYGLWKACMAGDEAAMARMARYCRQDVRLTENLHDLILPWIKNYPNITLYTSDEVDRCTRCGSPDLERRGFAHVLLVSYQQYKCRKCGAWPRGTKILQRAGETRAT